MTPRHDAVIVVGAAGGIGRALTGLLLDAGTCVIAVDRNGPLLESLGRPELERLQTIELDIADRTGVSELASRFGAAGQRFSGLVTTAGVHSTHPVMYLPDDLVDSVLDVNLASHVKLVRDFLPLMAPGGSIIGVSSIAACVGVPMSSMYSASKAGLEGFYESLWNEVRHLGIRVSVIHPGNVNTGFNETGNTCPLTGDPFTDSRYAAVVSRIDSRHGIPPEKVARAVQRVLAMKRPRFCYVVGGNARKANWAKKLLGRDAALRLMGRFFGF